MNPSSSKQHPPGEHLASHRQGSLQVFTIERESEGNQLTLGMISALAGAIRAAGQQDISAILIRSQGSDFSLGRDTRPAAPAANPVATGAPATALSMRSGMTSPILDVYDAIAGAAVPVIARVQGRALGFGCALATACDITIAADVARFQLPELEKNLPPTLAVSAMMARVPRKALTWMVYSMQQIDAQAALSLGIVSQVVPLAQLDDACEQIAAGLAQRSRPALVAVKDYFRSAPGMDARAASDYAANLLATVFSSIQK
jgi:enoyl-CoA hydratase/carnithine racemase